MSFNIKRLFIGALVLLVVMGCSPTIGKWRVGQPIDKQIHEIDDMIIAEKQDYINRCYTRVLQKKTPETTCEFRIFDALERRYGLSFSDRHVKTVADDIFFPEVFKKIHRMVRTRENVRHKVKNSFRSKKHLERYYRDLYSFHAHEMNNE
ncbi:MAG: hypothetical protein OCC49_03770 [Fibrobacterales bacterium]